MSVNKWFYSKKRRGGYTVKFKKRLFFLFKETIFSKSFAYFGDIAVTFAREEINILFTDRTHKE